MLHCICFARNSAVNWTDKMVFIVLFNVTCWRYSRQTSVTSVSLRWRTSMARHSRKSWRGVSTRKSQWKPGTWPRRHWWLTNASRSATTPSWRWFEDRSTSRSRHRETTTRSSRRRATSSARSSRSSSTSSAERVARSTSCDFPTTVSTLSSSRRGAPVSSATASSRKSASTRNRSTVLAPSEWKYDRFYFTRCMQDVASGFIYQTKSPLCLSKMSKVKRRNADCCRLFLNVSLPLLGDVLMSGCPYVSLFCSQFLVNTVG